MIFFRIVLRLQLTENLLNRLGLNWSEFFLANKEKVIEEIAAAEFVLIDDKLILRTNYFLEFGKVEKQGGAWIPPHMEKECFLTETSTKLFSL